MKDHSTSASFCLIRRNKKDEDCNERPSLIIKANKRGDNNTEDGRSEK